LVALKPLIHAVLVRKERQHIETFKQDIERHDPTRPSWRVNELNNQCSILTTSHDDARRRKKEAEENGKKAPEEPTSKAAAKVFQVLAGAFCRTQGASDDQLKALFGKLRRKERRSERKLLGAVRRVLQTKSSSAFRGKRSQNNHFPAGNQKKRDEPAEGWKNDIVYVRELMDAATRARQSAVM
jgi:hypothetical protein